jgi:cellulose synthase/poly-beta-1,6-N-acetylglucosamine synthase-like glycosyltransferase
MILGLDSGSRQPIWREWSADRILTVRQRIIGALATVGLIALGALDPHALLIALCALFIAIFVVTTVVRVGYLIVGYRARAGRAANFEPPRADELPTYTVFVPLYREANVVPALVEALDGLEYPREKLDVVLLVEHDDPETLRACGENLRPGWRIVEIPPGTPRTKPRALNVGLADCDAQLLTIYDAEDRPEPDQLLKAAAAFAALPDEVAALQARLDFYNSRQNVLTRWFACEYAAHFVFYLEGIGKLGHPMPLAGTSTHFRTDAVRDVGGWDPWNVTEDCELGMRLTCAGFEIRTLDSITWEEAVPRLGSWIRQRSRWVKGFAQTGLVLLRAPIRTARAMGWRRYALSLPIVPGVPVTLVAQGFFWALFVVYWVLRGSGSDVGPIESVFPEPLLSLAYLSLLVGNFAVLLLLVSAVYEEERFDLVGWALLTPVYWLLLFVGASKGVLQLIARPHFWEKTAHGLSDQETVRREEPAAVQHEGGQPVALRASPDLGEEES